MLLVAILAVAGDVTLGSGQATASFPALSSVSSQGTPFALPPNDPRTARLQQAGYANISVLAVANGRNFYRFEQQSGASCFGTGESDATWPIGAIKCRIAPPYFPSPELPVLDLSQIAMQQGDVRPTYVRIEGFAADGVASVGAVDEDGAVIDRIPVRGNVYSAPAPPSTVRLVALSEDNTVLANVR